MGGMNYVLFSFEKITGMGEEGAYSLDSLNASLDGGVISLEINQAQDGVAAINCLGQAHIEHTRLLTIAKGRLEVNA